MQPGKINFRDRAKQIADFSNMTFPSAPGFSGSITPTDIDGVLEYHDKCFVFFELKYTGGEIGNGQRIALSRIVSSLNKPAVLFLAYHNVYDCEKDIDVSRCIVSWHYSNRRGGINDTHMETKYYETRQVTLLEACGCFIDRYGK